jgi:hypothetical protein
VPQPQLFLKDRTEYVPQPQLFLKDRTEYVPQPQLFRRDTTEQVPPFAWGRKQIKFPKPCASGSYTERWTQHKEQAIVMWTECLKKSTQPCLQTTQEACERTSRHCQQPWLVKHDQFPYLQSKTGWRLEVQPTCSGDGKCRTGVVLLTSRYGFWTQSSITLQFPPFLTHLTSNLRSRCKRLDYRVGPTPVCCSSWRVCPVILVRECRFSCDGPNSEWRVETLGPVVGGDRDRSAVYTLLWYDVM